MGKPRHNLKIPVQRAVGNHGHKHPPKAVIAGVTSGQLASEYRFKDLDGSQPDIWRYIEEKRDRGLEANLNDYR
jgi:hypothetical protein